VEPFGREIFQLTDHAERCQCILRRGDKRLRRQFIEVRAVAFPAKWPPLVSAVYWSADSCTSSVDQHRANTDSSLSDSVYGVFGMRAVKHQFWGCGGRIPMTANTALSIQPIVSSASKY
jgi:hypothetical protein